jgi:hypothetical protein
MSEIVLVERFPGVDDYLRVARGRPGMHAKSREAAERALPNTLYGVRLERDGAVVGMGRVIGTTGVSSSSSTSRSCRSCRGRGWGSG